MDGKSERKINYRELQAIAKRMRLPGNLKYHLLIEIIDARRNGKEYIVDKILAEQKMERVRRKNEKLEAREAAYQHLRLSQDRKPLVKARKSVIHEPIPTSNDPSSWPNHDSLSNTNIRSLLSMPVESFQELLKKSKEQELQRNQERVEKQYSYDQAADNNNVQQRLMFAEQTGFLLDPSPNYRDSTNENGQYMNKALFPYANNADVMDGSLVLDHSCQDGKKSFQMKDILGQNDLNWSLNYNNQGYNFGGSFDFNQVQPDCSEMVPFQQDPFVSHYSYVNGADYWKNMYEVNQDSYRRRFVDYNGYAATCSSFPEPITSPNSDTISATDEDLSIVDQQDTVCEDYRNNNHVSFAMQQGYFNNHNNEQNQGFHEMVLPEVIDCQPTVHETQLQEHLNADRTYPEEVIVKMERK